MKLPASALPATTCAVLFALAALAAGAQDRDRSPARPPARPSAGPEKKHEKRPSASTPAFLEGLTALESARWAEAASAFGKAVAADDENPDFHTARGVALTLGEKLPQAIKELERSLQLRPGDRETKLWMGVALKMNGDAMKASLFFTHGKDVPPDYASFLYNEMANEYWQGVVKKTGTKTGRDKFARAGSWFASRAKGAAGSGGALTGSLLSRARERFRKGDHAGALADLESVRGSQGDQVEFLLLSAECRLALGDMENARVQFTRALTKKTDEASAYRGRALAAARLGDYRRAEADLKVAARLDAKGTATFKEKVKKDLDHAKSGKDPAALVSALRRSASAGAWEDLVKQGIALRKAAEAHRKRYDEDHQDRLRVLEEDLRSKPGDPDKLAALAAFLYSEAGVPRERVGPRDQPKPFRYQTAQIQAEEVARAEQLCDQALARNPKHPRALVTKAALRMWNNQAEQARPYLETLLALGPTDDPEVALEMVSVVEMDAARRRATASALRTDTLVRTEEFYSFTRYWWRSPTQEELRRAEQLDAQAKQMVETALAYLEKVATGRASSAEGLMCRAALQRRKKDWRGAQESLEKAVKLKPGLVDAHYQLAEVYSALGQSEKATEARLKALSLLQTSAAPRLQQVWGLVARTRWRSAKEALDKALALDPQDARSFAYLGMVALGQEKTDEAASCFRAALALEEARARLMGTTFQSGGKGPLTAEDVGLTMVVRLRLAKMRGSKHPAETLENMRGNGALKGRIDARALGLDVPAAMLPEAEKEPHHVPEAEVLASLLSWSRLYAGRALAAQKKPAEAAREWEAVVGMTKGMALATAPGRKKLDLPAGWAALELARQRLAAGDVEGAQKWLHQAGAWDRELEAQRKRLEAELAGRRKKASEAEEKRRAEEAKKAREEALRKHKEAAAAFEKKREEDLRKIKETAQAADRRRAEDAKRREEERKKREEDRRKP